MALLAALGSLREHLPTSQINAAIPAAWHTTTSTIAALYLSATSSTSATLVFTAVLAFFVPLVLALIPRISRAISLHMEATFNTNVKPFPFLELPPELRDMVYEYLLTDPSYPPPSRGSKKGNGVLEWIMPSAHAKGNGDYQRKKKGNWFFLANRQIYGEYMSLLCKKASFTLTVSPDNYPDPRNTACPTSHPTSQPSGGRIWAIAPSTLQQLRKCSINLITTSSMLGVPDPRDMTPTSWALAHQVKQELRSVKSVKELNLQVKAVCDPLWNPLWVWFHASQSFKTMGFAPSAPALSRSTSASSGSDSSWEDVHPSSLPPSPTTPSSASSSTWNLVSQSSINTPTDPPHSLQGPKLHRITFSLDTWSPGENYLERASEEEGGRWNWFCMEGHCIGPDKEGNMTVREFCARLYDECKVCHPDSEEEGEVHD